MRRVCAGFALVFLLASAAGPALAGPYSDDLAKCLVKSTTPEDKSLLVQWMFATMALHPDVKQLASVSDAERARLNRRVAKLIESLLTRSCLSETRDALKNEGQTTIETSFNVLGQVAARELFAHPDVAAGTADLARVFDADKLRKALATNEADAGTKARGSTSPR